ncbi:OFA family MFS transporter [Spirochaetia bacterium 38H-sp]|uniref:OFA family MFS transporter n=1 Tax=Rarispira pelagica TaxID=3141764 RepID=A0ABU9UD86_9SPIR
MGINRYLYVIGGILIYMCVGSIYSWSVFRNPLEELLGIGSFVSGLPYMLFLLFFSLSMPLAGRYIKKLGATLSVMIGNVLFLTGFLLAGISGNIVFITIGYGLISGIGVGVIYGVPIAVVSGWFPEKKGLVMGLTLAGFGLSPFVTAPFARYLIDLFGPIRSFSILGVVFFITIFIFSLLMRFADGEGESTKTSHNDSLFADKRFYGLWISYLIGTTAGLMAIGMTSPFAQEIIGMDGDTAAVMVSVLAIFNALGRPLFGMLTDKIKPFKVIVISFLLIIAASAMGLWLSEGMSVLFFVVFASLWLSLGGWLAIAPAATSFIFGHERFSANYGIMFVAYGMGAVVGTSISGQIKDMLGSYELAFYPVIGLTLIGLLVAFLTLREKTAA